MEICLCTSPSFPPSPASAVVHLYARHLWNSAAAAHQLHSHIPCILYTQHGLQGSPAPQLVRGTNRSKTNKSWTRLLTQPQFRVVGRTPQGPGIQVGAVLFLVQPATIHLSSCGRQLKAVHRTYKRSDRRPHLGWEATKWGDYPKTRLALGFPGAAMSSDFYILSSKHFITQLKGEPHLLWWFGCQCPRTSLEIALGEPTPCPCTPRLLLLLPSSLSTLICPLVVPWVWRNGKLPHKLVSDSQHWPKFPLALSRQEEAKR